MRRLILRVVLSVGWLTAVAGPVCACINDGSAARDEKQFQSSYPGKPASPSPMDRIASAARPIAVGVGVAMLVGALLVGVVAVKKADEQLRKRAEERLRLREQFLDGKTP